MFPQQRTDPRHPHGPQPSSPTPHFSGSRDRAVLITALTPTLCKRLPTLVTVEREQPSQDGPWPAVAVPKQFTPWPRSGSPVSRFPAQPPRRLLVLNTKQPWRALPSAANFSWQPRGESLHRKSPALGLESAVSGLPAPRLCTNPPTPERLR